MSRVPVPGNRASWGRLNPGLARTKRATGGLGGGFWKRNAKVYRGWVPCNQDSGTQAGHGRWAVGGGVWTVEGVELCPTAAVGTDTSRFSKIARVHW